MSPREPRLPARGPALVAALLVACASPGSPSPAAPPSSAPARAAPLAGLHFEIEAVDRAVDPCVDFYDYACGGWRRTHPIPPDRSRWGRYAELEVENLARERAIVEEAARGGPGASPAEQRVGAYYAACMDEGAIDARGLEPVRELLARIAAVKTGHDAALVLGELHAHGVRALFEPSADVDFRDTRRQLFSLGKGELGLPDADDYSRQDATAAALREGYRQHLARLFQLAGEPEPDARADADRTLALETALAAHAMKDVDARRLEDQYHPMTLAELGQRFPRVDWPAYFGALGVAAPERVNVPELAWMAAAEDVLASADPRGLRAALRALALQKAAAVLPGAIDAEVFDFHGRALRGTKAMSPRSDRCLRLVDRDLGDEVGRIFVARYFPGAARARMKGMIDALLTAFRADLQGSDWLGPAARAAAAEKLGKMLVVVGASNRPRSFDGLEVDRGDAFGNAWRARALDVAHGLSAAREPTDRERFFDALPQELDGFGEKSLNATGFTAGFLQPPVFDLRLDDAVNFGGLGSVIGHELTHHLDDEGRKYDADGNLRPWWSPEDVARFEERAKCFADEYSRFRAEDGTPLDGKLTLGENVADNGGIRLSYAALRPSLTGPRLDGYTPAQRFFLAWGQIRCENLTPEAARRQALTNEHSAGRWRVDGVVPNVPEFASAFSCAAGAPMAPEHRCRVW